MRAHGDQWLGRRDAGGTVEGDLGVPDRAVDLAPPQRLVPGPGVRERPPPALRIGLTTTTRSADRGHPDVSLLGTPGDLATQLGRKKAR